MKGIFGRSLLLGCVAVFVAMAYGRSACGDGFSFSVDRPLTYSAIQYDLPFVFAEDGHRKARAFRTMNANHDLGEKQLALGIIGESDGSVRRYAQIRHPFQPLAVSIEREPSERIKVRSITCRVVPQSQDGAMRTAYVWVGATDNICEVVTPKDGMDSSPWEKRLTIPVNEKFEIYQTPATRGGRFAIVGIETVGHSLDIETVEWAHVDESSSISAAEIERKTSEGTSPNSKATITKVAVRLCRKPCMLAKHPCLVTA